MSSERYQVNCSGHKISAWKKRLTLEVASSERGYYCFGRLFSFAMGQEFDFPDQTKNLLGRENHAHYELKPTIVSADESLRSLSPKQ
jgi:hypothetical protein